MRCWRGYLSGVRRKWFAVHVVQLMPLPSHRLNSVPACPGWPGKEDVKRASAFLARTADQTACRPHRGGGECETTTLGQTDSDYKKTRHRASTSMYSLTFLVRVTTRPQCGRNGTAHAAGASMLSLARGVIAGMRSATHSVRRAVGPADYRWALSRISNVAIAKQPVHRLQIRPIVHD